MIGRHMQNALINLNIENEFKEALMKIGYNLEQIYDEEVFLPFLLIYSPIWLLETVDLAVLQLVF